MMNGGPVRLYDANGLPIELVTTGVPVWILNGGAGGTASVDETVFVPGGSSGTPAMGVVNPSDTPSDGDLVVVAVDNQRRLKVVGSFSSTPVQSNTSTVAAQVAQGTTAAEILAANASRVRFMVQNVGTTVIKLILGAGTPTQTAFHVALPAGGADNDGSSPVYIDTLWIGAVQAISSASGGLLVVTEFE